MLLTLGLTTHPLSARADDAAPVSYRHIDWITKEEIAALPPEQRPTYTGLCSGFYVAPSVLAPEGSTVLVHAAADRFDTWSYVRLLLDGDVFIRRGTS